MTTRSVRPIAVVLGLLVVLCLLPVVRDAGQWARAAASWRVGTTSHSVTVAGMRRDFRVYRPAGLPASAPLVVFLHPAFGSPAQSAADYGWNRLADREKVVVAYPAGVGSSWNAGTCCGRAQSRGVDDVAFVRAMVEQVGAHVPLDAARIFAVGFSNGALMTERLACDTGLFAAVAEVAGTRVTTSCTPAAAAAPSVLYVHGLLDTNVRWDGVPGAGMGEVDGEPRETSLEAWRTLLGCRTPSTTTQAVGPTSVVRTSAACSDGRAVASTTLSDAGHQYPGAVRHPARERLLGLPAPSTAIDATTEIWAFLAAHPRRG